VECGGGCRGEEIEVVLRATVRKDEDEVVEGLKSF